MANYTRIEKVIRYLNDSADIPNEEVIAQLAQLNGIGIWTAEMLLIFSMLRKNVLSYGDLVTRKSLMRLHDLDSLTKKNFAQYKDLYSSYSTASLHLWTKANMKKISI